MIVGINTTRDISKLSQISNVYVQQFRNITRGIYSKYDYKSCYTTNHAITYTHHIVILKKIGADHLTFVGRWLISGKNIPEADFKGKNVLQGNTLRGQNSCSEKIYPSWGI